MAWREIRRIIGRAAGQEASGMPTPVMEELAEMGAADPLLVMALERRRGRRTSPRDEVYARYGYLLFIPTNR